ncbi:hypothetical protein CHX27_00880 [Flavobacterium aurantiibacter]|uniref:Uncharacterized protein n=1 Tax=Flavobacterium aurantiibacter TaxID=2023067 RepID=A0A256A9L0_9FLAO|nr:hypothetical protein CHX27_00880 [Flavobacterium aurantiibacter]
MDTHQIPRVVVYALIIPGTDLYKAACLFEQLFFAVFSFFFGRAGKRVVAAPKRFTPSRVPLYLFGKRSVEIKIAKKYAAAPVRAGKLRKIKDFDISRLKDFEIKRFKDWEIGL